MTQAVVVYSPPLFSFSPVKRDAERQTAIPNLVDSDVHSALSDGQTSATTSDSRDYSIDTSAQTTLPSELTNLTSIKSPSDKFLDDPAIACTVDVLSLACQTLNEDDPFDLITLEYVCSIALPAEEYPFDLTSLEYTSSIALPEQDDILELDDVLFTAIQMPLPDVDDTLELDGLFYLALNTPLPEPDELLYEARNTALSEDEESLETSFFSSDPVIQTSSPKALPVSLTRSDIERI